MCTSRVTLPLGLRTRAARCNKEREQPAAKALVAKRAIATNCYKIATVGVLPDRAAANFEFEIGSGVGIRTLNLAVNSRLLYR